MKGVTPFQILIAEFFLRQTRTVVVKRVFTEFVERFPTPNHILRADRKSLIEVMKPLGIISRVDEVKELAKLVEKRYSAGLPRDKESLKMLPGVGEYTASAVRIFAFNEQDVLVDTNIMRIISRLFGTKDLETIKGHLISMSEDEDVDLRQFYSMLIDFGALVCKAVNTRHDVCPVRDCCMEYERLAKIKDD
ncbi:MAG: hypothetical protein ABSB40_11010 [Nitrososphaeria archaeon]|jgi:A/G-specific adenine glycosylase